MLFLYFFPSCLQSLSLREQLARRRSGLDDSSKDGDAQICVSNMGRETGRETRVFGMAEERKGRDLIWKLAYLSKKRGVENCSRLNPQNIVCVFSHLNREVHPHRANRFIS